MSTKLKLIFGVLFSILILESCEREICTDYSICNELDEEVCVYFCHEVYGDTVCVPSQSSEQWRYFCLLEARYYEEFDLYDSIVFRLDSVEKVFKLNTSEESIYNESQWSLTEEDEIRYFYKYTITEDDLN
jgi:hypothetical protein